MQLTLDDLQRRHEYWKYEIGRAGIWNPLLFLPVLIQIRKKHKVYNAVFQRRTIKKSTKVEVSDKIVMYRNSDNFDEKFIDSVLVHEMIHQYIFQNNIKDTRAHGPVFKKFMTHINREFEGRLEIRLKDTNSRLPLEGPGETIHSLLVVKTRLHIFCCVIHPRKLPDFDKKAIKGTKTGMFRSYGWFISDDVHFNRFTRCMRTLHGERLPLAEWENYRLKYRLIPV